MKTKILTILIALAAILPSCQQLMENQTNDLSDFADVSSSKSRANALQKPYFADGWQALPSHAEKLDALQLDENLLKSLSTEQLVDVCMDYPLAFDCFFFNDINHGFEKVVSRFNGFQELATRQDAKIEIIKYYQRFVESKYYNTIDEKSDINPLQLAFIELMVQCDQFGDLAQYSENSILTDALSKVELLRSSYDGLNGQIYNETHSHFRDCLNLDVTTNPFIKKPVSTKNVRIHTVFGWSLDAIEIQCDSNLDEENYGRWFIATYYPNAVIVGPASCTYNCHAYAWYVSEGGRKYWINASDSPYVYNTNNISAFWKDGYYEKCDASKATKVFYDEGEDHSAIVINKDLFESKWGKLQIVQHKPEDCPYETYKLNYYRPDPNGVPIPQPNPNPTPDPGPSSSTYYGSATWSMYPNPLPVGYETSFYMENTYNGSYSIEVYVTTIKDNNNNLADPSVYSVLSQDGNSATIKFNKLGAYRVCFKVTHKASGHVDAIFQSDFVYVE